MKFKATINQKVENLNLEEMQLGDHQAYIASNEYGNQYYVKTSYIPPIPDIRGPSQDPNISYYLEVLAARFYKFLATKTFMADTTFFIKEDGSVNIASKWIENYVPYAEVGLPYISGDKIVIKLQGKEREVHGYLEMLLVARYIGNFDCIGKGTNAGYIIEEDGTVRNVKTDPGGALSFVDKDLFNVILGPILNINQKLYNKYLKYSENCPDFYTDIALEMIDDEDPLKLNELYKDINIFLDYYYPELDLRDLLIDNLRYQDIPKDSALYHSFAEAVYKIITMTEIDLRSLIYDDMPEEINGENLQQVKDIILQTMIARKAKIYKLYKQEFMYYSSYLGKSEELDIAAIPLIEHEDIQQTLSKSIKILENLFEYIKNESVISLDDASLTAEDIDHVLEQLREYEENVVELNLLYHDLGCVIELIDKQAFDLVRAILKNNHVITFNFPQELLINLPEELQKMVIKIKELHKDADLSYSFGYINSSDDDSTNYREIDISHSTISSIEQSTEINEDLSLLKYIKHLLSIFEETISYNDDALENNIVTDILDQVAFLVNINGVSYNMPWYLGRKNSYGFPEDDDGDYNEGNGASGVSYDDAASSLSTDFATSIPVTILSNGTTYYADNI